MRALASSSLLALAFLAVAACATGGAPAGGVPQVTFKEQSVANVTTFDLANCFPRELKVPSPVNETSLRAFLVAAQPQVNECLVDPKSRGPERAGKVTLTATVTSEGPRFEASGPNVSPAGAQCISGALQKKGGLEPLPGGARPVTVSFDFQHQVGREPAVVMGVNQPSDALGLVRLSLPGWCDCFEPWKESAPASLSGKLVVSPPEDDKGEDAPKPATTVQWDPPANETASGVQACITEKVKTVGLASTEKTYEAPLPVYLIHSGIDELVGEDKPEVALQQLYALRAQNLARLDMAPARRTNASATYDATVAKYKANPKSVSVKDLRDRCQDLLDADDAWMKALQTQISREQKALQFLEGQRAKDPSWAPEVETARKQIAMAETDLATAKETRVKDEAACPKVTWETKKR